ncbi:hypothetical protein FQN60_010549, partial [Etheostoma spectabile]
MSMDSYAAKLKELEILFSDMNGGLKPANSAEMEAALRAAEEMVDDLQYDAELLTVNVRLTTSCVPCPIGSEKNLQTRLASISRSQLAEGLDIQNIADTADAIKRREKTYKAKVAAVQSLMEEMRRELSDARDQLRLIEIPLGDAPLSSNLLSSLVQTATSLADKHETTADAVERSANDALGDSQKSLDLVRTLMNKENKVKELIGDLKTTYDQHSAQVKGLENQATRLSTEAGDESKMADGMLKDIANMERSIPSSLKDSVQRDKAATEDLLARGKTAQKVPKEQRNPEFDKLSDRVDIAKLDTEDALRRINSNTNELDDALNNLRAQTEPEAPVLHLQVHPPPGDLTYDLYRWSCSCSGTVAESLKETSRPAHQHPNPIPKWPPPIPAPSLMKTKKEVGGFLCWRGGLPGGVDVQLTLQDVVYDGLTQVVHHMAVSVLQGQSEGGT